MKTSQLPDYREADVTKDARFGKNERGRSFENTKSHDALFQASLGRQTLLAVADEGRARNTKQRSRATAEGSAGLHYFAQPAAVDAPLLDELVLSKSNQDPASSFVEAHSGCSDESFEELLGAGRALDGKIIRRTKLKQSAITQIQSPNDL